MERKNIHWETKQQIEISIEMRLDFTNEHHGIVGIENFSEAYHTLRIDDKEHTQYGKLRKASGYSANWNNKTNHGVNIELVRYGQQNKEMYEHRKVLWIPNELPVTICALMQLVHLAEENFIK